jgi:serine/threonine protein kinase
VFRFKYLEIIGNGTFGIVCRAQDLDTKEIVAVKTVYQDEGHQVFASSPFIKSDSA